VLLIIRVLLNICVFSVVFVNIPSFDVIPDIYDFDMFHMIGSITYVLICAQSRLSMSILRITQEIWGISTVKIL
jgi:hypothetical protein